MSGATNGRGGDSYRFRGSCSRRGRGAEPGGGYRRDPRHGSADLERRKLPARSRAGETVVGVEVESAQAEDGEELSLRTLAERALGPMSGRNGGVGILKGRNG